MFTLLIIICFILFSLYIKYILLNQNKPVFKDHLKELSRKILMGENVNFGVYKFKTYDNWHLGYHSIIISRFYNEKEYKYCILSHNGLVGNIHYLMDVLYFIDAIENGKEDILKRIDYDLLKIPLRN